MDELKKIFLAGVGVTAVSIEKAAGVVDEMVAKGRVTVKEGKELQSELTRKVANLKPTSEADLKELKEQIAIIDVKKADISALDAKLDLINEKLDRLLDNH